jgi:hypothetical protein
MVVGYFLAMAVSAGFAASCERAGNRPPWWPKSGECDPAPAPQPSRDNEEPPGAWVQVVLVDTTRGELLNEEELVVIDDNVAHRARAPASVFCSKELRSLFLKNVEPGEHALRTRLILRGRPGSRFAGYAFDVKSEHKVSVSAARGVRIYEEVRLNGARFGSGEDQRGPAIRYREVLVSAGLEGADAGGSR